MKTLLLIEDHVEMRENIAEILELAGYEVITAENGKVGVVKALEHRPDLIVCDIMMPELDGYGVLRVLSRNPGVAGIPFIFLTAKAERSDWRKGMQLGADDYLTKPFEDSELLEVIELRLKKNEIVQQDIPRDINGVNNFINEVRSRAALEELASERECRLYKAKEIIFQEGRHPHHLFFIQSGKVKSFKINEDAKEYIAGLHSKGDFLGYTALLKNTPYADSAVALEDTEVLLIPKEDFLSLMYNNRDIAYKFVKLLSEDVEDKEKQLLHLAYDTIRKRVADALILLQNRYHENPDQDFSMPISRENLANIVGTSKECVIRVLSEFKHDGLIKTKKSEIYLLAPEKIAQIKF